MSVNLFIYNGTGHIATLYAKMRNEPITEYDLHSFSSKNFPYHYRTRETLKRLEKNGLLSRSDAGWKITKFGITHLRAIARPYYGENPQRYLNLGSKNVSNLKKKTNNSKKN